MGFQLFDREDKGRDDRSSDWRGKEGDSGSAWRPRVSEGGWREREKAREKSWLPRWPAPLLGLIDFCFYRNLKMDLNYTCNFNEAY